MQDRKAPRSDGEATDGIVLQKNDRVSSNTFA